MVRVLGPGGGGGSPIYKKHGVLVGNFEKTSLRVTKIHFSGGGLKFFSTLRGINSYITHYLLSYFFNTLKGTVKAPAVDLLRLNTLRGTKTVFLTPNRYDQHPCHFYMGIPSPLGFWEAVCTSPPNFCGSTTPEE